MGTSHSPDGGDKAPGSSVKPTAFVANRIQLAGPVPAALRHRYVGFAPFVKAMFKRSGVRGMILHHALHKQHLHIYKWDKNVVWGVIDDDEDAEAHKHDRIRKYDERTSGDKDLQVQNGDATQSNDADNSSPITHAKDKKQLDLSSNSVAFARQFLKMVSYGTHGRIFTYVIMLDGEWRFTVSTHLG